MKKHILTHVMTLRYSINFSHYSFFQLLKREDYWTSHQIIDIPTFYIMGKTISNPIKLELHIDVHGSSKAAKFVYALGNNSESQHLAQLTCRTVDT